MTTLRQLRLVLLLALLGCAGPGLQPDGGRQPSTAAAEPSKGAATCDNERIGATAAALADARSNWKASSGSIDDRGEEAASAIWLSCGSAVPRDLRVYLHSVAVAEPRLVEADGIFAEHAEFDSRLPGHESVHGVSFSSEAPDVAAACPGFVDIASNLGELPGSERPGALYDRCKFAGVDVPLASRDEFVSAGLTASGAYAFAMARWLEDHGINAQDARSLSRELLRRRAATDGWLDADLTELALPTAVGGAPLGEGIVTEIRDAAIYVRGTRAVELKQGRPPAALMTGSRIDPLFDSLADAHDSKLAAARQAGTTPSETVLLAAPPSTSWETVRLVVATAREAGLSRVEVIGLGEERFAPLRSVVIEDKRHPVDELGVPPGANLQDALVRALRRQAAVHQPPAD